MAIRPRIRVFGTNRGKKVEGKKISGAEVFHFFALSSLRMKQHVRRFCTSTPQWHPPIPLISFTHFARARQSSFAGRLFAAKESFAALRLCVRLLNLFLVAAWPRQSPPRPLRFKKIERSVATLSPLLVTWPMHFSVINLSVNISPATARGDWER